MIGSLVFSVWNFGVWDLKFEVMGKGFGVRSLGFSILEFENLGFCFWILIWCLEFWVWSS